MTASINISDLDSSHQEIFKNAWYLVGFAKVWMESDHQAQLNRLLSPARAKELLKETLKDQGYTEKCLVPDGTRINGDLPWVILAKFAKDLSVPKANVKASLDRYINVVCKDSIFK